MSEAEFFCEGYIRVKIERSWIAEVGQIIVRDRDNPAAPPVMLDIKDDLKKYIEELYKASLREEYMRKRFYFNEWCELRKIEVLDDGGNAVKTIKPGGEWRPFIGEIKEENTE